MNRYAQRVAELTAGGEAEYIVEINEKDIEPVTEDKLRRIEAYLGVPLPADYREFVRDYGGIWLCDNECRLASLYKIAGARASISRFYGYSDFNNTGTRQEDTKTPPELIVIGESGNTTMYLAVRGEHTGSVYWEDPLYFPEKLYYYPDLQLVARSFDQFIHALKFVDSDHQYTDDHREQEKRENTALVEKLLQIELRADNAYTPLMASLQGRYVYSTVGDDAKQLSESDLQTIEAEVGHPLPSDYREFLRSFGGYGFLPKVHTDGTLRAAVLPYLFVDNDPNRRTPKVNYSNVKYFHGHIGSDYHDLLGHYRRLVKNLPSGLLPIADAGELCIKIAGENIGSVYVAKGASAYESNPDNFTPRDPIQENDLILVAPSFDAFIGSFEMDIPRQQIG